MRSVAALALVAFALIATAAAEADVTAIAGLRVSAADAADWSSFQAFVVKHARAYGGVEETLRRFSVFQQNLRRAEDLTRQHNGEATFGVTRFSDLSPEEFAAKYLTLNASAITEHVARAKRAGTITPWADTEEGAHALAQGLDATPTKVDWNALKKVTPVRDQGDCGCCWAFTTCAEMESQILVKGYASAPTLILSPQQFVDCDGSNSACSGGFYVSAWQYAYNNGGVMQEPEYPYADAEGSCRWNAASQYNVKPANGGSTTPGTAAANIYAFINSHGPAAAAIDSTPLQTYTGGVLSLATASCPSLNHAVTITGYDSSAGYFRVKNSWGDTWGESGFFRVKTTSCGISSNVYGSTGF